MERPGATTLRGDPKTLIGPELKPGDPAPDFEVVDNSLKPVTPPPTSARTTPANCPPRTRRPSASCYNRRSPKQQEEKMERPGATTLRGDPKTLIGPELKPGDPAPDF